MEVIRLLNPIFCLFLFLANAHSFYAMDNKNVKNKQINPFESHLAISTIGLNSLSSSHQALSHCNTETSMRQLSQTMSLTKSDFFKPANPIAETGGFSKPYSLSLQNKHDLPVTRPALSAHMQPNPLQPNHGQWKSATLSTAQSNVNTFKLQQTAIPVQAIKMSQSTVEGKKSIVSQQAAHVTSHLRNCAQLSAETKNLLAIDKLAITESKFLNDALQHTKHEISQIIYEKDGWFMSGSGKFQGLRYQEDVKKFNAAIDKFEQKVEHWKNNAELINRDILHDKAGSSPLFKPAQAYDVNWDYKIKNHPYNLDLFKVNDLLAQKDFEGAQSIIKIYEGRIGYTKDGWIKDSPQYNEYLEIKNLYIKEYFKEYNHAGIKRDFAQDPLIENIKITPYEGGKTLPLPKKELNEVFYKRNLLYGKMLSDLGIKQPSIQETELAFKLVDINLGLDTKLTTPETLQAVEFDTKLFQEVLKDPELAQLIHGAFEKPVTMSPSFPEQEKLSLYQHVDEFLKSYAHICEVKQQEAMDQTNPALRYWEISSLEMNKKLADFGQGALHQIETAEGIIEGLHKVGQLMKPLVEFMGQVELAREHGTGNLEMATKKYEEFAKNISNIQHHLQSLSPEEKVKFATDLIFDFKVAPVLISKAGKLAGALKNVSKELVQSENLKKLAQIPEKLRDLTQFSEECGKHAQQLEEVTTKIQLIQKYEQEAIQLAKKIENITNLEQSIEKLLTKLEKVLLSLLINISN